MRPSFVVPSPGYRSWLTVTLFPLRCSCRHLVLASCENLRTLCLAEPELPQTSNPPVRSRSRRRHPKQSGVNDPWVKGIERVTPAAVESAQEFVQSHQGRKFIGRVRARPFTVSRTEAPTGFIHSFAPLLAGSHGSETTLDSEFCLTRTAGQHLWVRCLGIQFRVAHEWHWEPQEPPAPCPATGRYPKSESDGSTSTGRA